ncbi:hypothetical protein, partial [Nocardioides sp.]|uniref:hypothetical protein n=1 Tax=Nocardioides sp. TaxID=35761 RepID=UPI0031FECEB6
MASQEVARHEEAGAPEAHGEARRAGREHGAVRVVAADRVCVEAWRRVPGGAWRPVPAEVRGAGCAGPVDRARGA